MGYCVKNQNDFPSKNRVWDFFSRGECYAGDFQLQVVEVHQEKEGVGTMIASGRVEHYQYDPFGNIIHLKDFDTTGVVHDNPYRFSTKFTDDETGLVYYGFRFYNPVLGRWINRDPIGERGGRNNYGWSENDGVNLFDILGLKNPDGWQSKEPYNIGIGEEDDVWGSTDFHVPHCAGFGGTGNTEGWAMQYEIVSNEVPHEGAVDRIAEAIANLAGTTDDACYGGKVQVAVTVKRKTQNIYVWKVCVKVHKLEKCNCKRCCGPEGPTECEDVTPKPVKWNCDKFEQLGDSIIEIGD